MQYTKDSSFIGFKEISTKNMASYFGSLKNRQYYYADFVYIFDQYNKHCKIVNLDTLLVVSQMAHETDYIRSWWAGRPRRNPAGLRVTGESKSMISLSDDLNEWQYDNTSRLFKRGRAYPSWEHSVKAQLGHLLCYIYKDHEMTSEQLAYSNYSPNKNTLNSVGYRGVAKKVDGLSKRWAVGEYYGEAIARMANNLKLIDNM